jgi:hypothetical protein
MKKSPLFIAILLIANAASFGQWTNSTDIYNTNSGNVGIGTTTPQFLLDVRRTTSGTAGLITNYVEAESTSSTTDGIGALTAIGRWAHPSGTANRVIAVAGAAYHTGAGTVTSMRGFQSNIVLLGSGSATDAFCFFGGAGTGGSGGITNAYGYYMGMFPPSTPNKWGVFIQDNTAKNYFAGSIGIGTTTPGSYKLAVEGKIGAREIRVTNENPWADFVFKPDYKLPTLQEVEAFIKEKGHLPGIPSANEVKKEGYDMSKMDASLLQKIEELTLHVIELNKKVEALAEENKQLKKVRN